MGVILFFVWFVARDCLPFRAVLLSSPQPYVTPQWKSLTLTGFSETVVITAV